MARYCGVWRLRLWWCLCVCLLCAPVASEAATRKYVTRPSAQTEFTKATSVSGTAESFTASGAAIEGEYIPAATKNVPVRGILGGVESGATTISSGLKKGLKSNPGQLALMATVSAALAGVDWVMNEGVLSKKIDQTAPTSQYCYLFDYSGYGSQCDSPNALAGGLGAYFSATGRSCPTFSISLNSSKSGGIIYFSCNTGSFSVNIHSNGACSGSVNSFGDCVVGTQFVPLSSADYDSIDPWLNKQSASWLNDLLKDVCNASNSPGACFDEMKTASKALTGPATVDAGTQTTTSTYTKPDGTTGSRQQTQQVTYNIKYGDTYYDYSKEIKTVNYEDGVKTGESTESEDPNVTDEQPAEEDDQPSASPCAANCDGPAYTDLYTPTTDTKESALDSYAARVRNIPIINAASNFFTVSVSASCPIWQANGSVDLLGKSFDYDLKFDYHCQPWFTDYRSFAMAVVLIIAALGAFWVATLD
ncbi:hypothetical protein [Pseudomonas citronellolis]|uniref:hypothetical protein n=1 Tax=Pseudomonas citronellolis TaxID=53408 RepID=UPI002D78FFEF|nr:hypothetical protein [Pseudomonas citronellolis]WRT81703.1 hypothetical protein VK748_25175 [Pseudomonas citronellolis]WRT81715.1 hypothetical protein VK748_25235 [Pseudomonas citronellolis]